MNKLNVFTEIREYSSKNLGIESRIIFNSSLLGGKLQLIYLFKKPIEEIIAFIISLS